MSADASQSEDKPKSGKMGALMMPILAALNLSVVGGGAFLVYKATLGDHPPTLREPAAIAELEAQRTEGKTPEAVMYTMPGFLVNLEGSPSRLIKVEMTFEMLDKEGFEEIVRNSPAARDEIVRILNRKTFDDVESIQGKLFLKDQIAVALNRSMNSGVIKDIYFNQFLVQ
ncbi:MAG TPA: flagellar basal body-associated FliL family protein [Bdellovibrionales bacterium]|nr:flagellar basal body-associated FliL family protein [Bdellovibrionales bacterium]